MVKTLLSDRSAIVVIGNEAVRMTDVGLEAYLTVGAVLFVCGVVCMATKRNAIGVLMGVELVLNGANVNFVAFSRYTPLG